MTISLIRPLPVGNALQLFLSPPPGARWWRVLRRPTDAFTGPDDTGAAVAADECTDAVVVDDTGLDNEAAYFYRAYYRLASGWSASATRSGTPSATYRGDAADPQTLLRERLRLGLSVEIARGALQPPSGTIEVLAAPFALAENVELPVVSVVYQSGSPDQRDIGEMGSLDEGAEDIGGIGTEGWLKRVTIQVVAFSFNPDERIALRQALERIVLANMPVFSARGLSTVTFSQRDDEGPSVGENAPTYATVGTFDCLAPAWIEAPRSSVGSISRVTVAPTYATPFTGAR